VVAVRCSRREKTDLEHKEPVRSTLRETYSESGPIRTDRVSSVPRLLSAHTTLRLGGPAGTWIEARDEGELVDATVAAEDENLFVLGGGSNVVVADDGFEGTVVRVMTQGIERALLGDTVRLDLQAGVDWDEVVELAVEEGWAGIECLSGIPGTVGACPQQNVGAYERSLEECLYAARVYDRLRSEVLDLAPGECHFGYRTSRFKREAGRFLILRVGLELKRQPHSLPILNDEVADLLGVPIGDVAPLADVREAVLELRRGTGMVLDDRDLDTCSTGSFFMNPLLGGDQTADLVRRIESLEARGGRKVPRWRTEEGLTKASAAWLIEEAGFGKGYGNPAGVAI
jgi:UDP-N-acetylmuramate dehydrogenase